MNSITISFALSGSFFAWFPRGSIEFISLLDWQALLSAPAVRDRPGDAPLLSGTNILV
jgi:hypothetical protein